MSDYLHLMIDRVKPGLWTVTFSNPPINLLEPATITELQALVSEVVRPADIPMSTIPLSNG